jgi:hypothetical protein
LDYTVSKTTIEAKQSENTSYHQNVYRNLSQPTNFVKIDEEIKYQVVVKNLTFTDWQSSESYKKIGYKAVGMLQESLITNISATTLPHFQPS